MCKYKIKHLVEKIACASVAMETLCILLKIAYLLYCY